LLRVCSLRTDKNVLVTSDGKPFALSATSPPWSRAADGISRDTDRKQAAATRVKMLDVFAADKTAMSARPGMASTPSASSW
jgi:hypothetical protein